MDFFGFRPIPSRKNLARFGLLPAVVLPFLLYSYFWEPRQLDVVPLRIVGVRPLRIALISDIHFKGDARYLEKVVRAINQLQVDMVCHAGDFLEQRKHLDGLLPLIEQIRHPVYAVAGNHEHWSGADLNRLDAVLKKTGGALLVNQAVRLREGFSLIGVDSLLGGNPDVQKALQGTEGTKRIFLFHEPQIVEQCQEANFVLALAGHSHGGQVRIPFYGAIILPPGVRKYERGLYHTPGGPLFVTSGVGTWGVPIRFLCRPEIVLIESGL